MPCHAAAADIALPGSRLGARLPSSRVRQHAVRNSRTFRFCCRHVATTLSTRSTNRLPAGLSVPPLLFRHNTPWRNVRSGPLLVGSTPSTQTKVHMADSCFSSLRQVPAVFLHEHSAPRSNCSCTACRKGPTYFWNDERARVPSRTRCHQWNIWSDKDKRKVPMSLPESHRSIIAWKSRRKCAQQSCRRLIQP